MTKHAAKVGVVVLLAGFWIPSAASATEILCQNKAGVLQRQLDHAQEHGEQHRVKGLQRALRALEDGCTNSSVLNDAADEVQASLAEVQERQADFEEALSDGDNDDIQKRRIKLEEATHELEIHTQELNALQQQVDQ